ncbi:hypothetical protein A5681_02205 [Mycobacterium scrofulaceum]|uniref:hypothetical protein n=1 Tax=Mycobacterium scrofulaceum TaxID=1783 RepID=UPI0007FC4CA5|nr:hypothetical protein [Mycobacterium scrofulaceum]OBH84506.1 hypothetical protein A5681_02205 [Mycobacterium scrofulaceum]
MSGPLVGAAGAGSAGLTPAVREADRGPNTVAAGVEPDCVRKLPAGVAAIDESRLRAAAQDIRAHLVSSIAERPGPSYAGNAAAHGF